MALDQAYFDAIDIEIVKKKYYNANKVEAVFEDIRRRARELTEENERMRRQLALLTGQKDEIGETLLSAKSIAQNVLREAQDRAEAIVAEAEARARETEAAAARSEESVRRVEACYSRVREQLLGCVDELNADFQAYLCSLDGDAESAPPADLDEKVGAIAREIFALDDEERVSAESFES